MQGKYRIFLTYLTIICVGVVLYLAFVFFMNEKINIVAQNSQNALQADKKGDVKFGDSKDSVDSKTSAINDGDSKDSSTDSLESSESKPNESSKPKDSVDSTNSIDSKLDSKDSAAESSENKSNESSESKDSANKTDANQADSKDSKESTESKDSTESTDSTDSKSDSTNSTNPDINEIFPKSYIVNADILNAREKPSTKSRILKKYTRGEILVIKNVDSSWGELERGGFVYMEFLREVRDD